MVQDGPKAFIQKSSLTGDEIAPIVSIHNLTFRHVSCDTPALQNLSLDVNRGEVLMIMGVSGSGESSLCYTFNGLIPHFVQGEYDGVVRVMGKEPAMFPVWQQTEQGGHGLSGF